MGFTPDGVRGRTEDCGGAGVETPTLTRVATDAAGAAFAIAVLTVTGDLAAYDGMSPMVTMRG